MQVSFHKIERLMLRQGLLTQTELAEAIGISGPSTSRILKMARDGKDLPPGLVARLIQGLGCGLEDIEADPLAQAAE